MMKKKESAVVRNLKLSIANLKIDSDAIKRFSIFTIDNEYANNAFIFQSLLKIFITNINVPSHSFYWEVKNVDSNKKCNKSEIEKRI